MAVKRVVTIATEEFVRDAIKGLEIAKFEQLKTSDKTVLGAINEVNDMLGMFVVPEYDITAQMYYGILDPKDVGNIHSFRDITFEMLNQDHFISTKPGERALIRTGLFIDLIRGFELQIRSRSGLALKHGIIVLNEPGSIDSDFKDEIGVILCNLGAEDFTINNGDRIAQMVLAKVERLYLDVVDEKINNYNKIKLRFYVIMKILSVLS